jgi:hypothetical protein
VLEVDIDEIDVRVDDGEALLGHAAEAIGGTRSVVVEELAEVQAGLRRRASGSEP